MKFKTGDILIDPKRTPPSGTSRALFVFLSTGATTHNVVRIGHTISAGRYRKRVWVSLNDQLENVRHVRVGHDRGLKKITAEELKMLFEEMKKGFRVKKNVIMSILIQR